MGSVVAVESSGKGDEGKAKEGLRRRRRSKEVEIKERREMRDERREKSKQNRNSSFMKASQEIFDKAV